MTIHPKDVLSRVFTPKLKPPRRMTEADSLLLEIRDAIAKAQNIAELREPLATLLADCLHELQLEKISRTHPGMIGMLTKDAE